MNLPLISIVTVTYNAASVLEETILSVISQSYENIEYILIDGGSTDNTVDIIKKYEDQISYWISEQDKGIYDAMNKGIEKVSGTWVNFMNAGDKFYNDHTLYSIFIENRANIGNTHIIYGDTVIVGERYSYMEIPDSLEQINKGKLNFCHQSSFVQKDVLKKCKFDLQFKICADYKLFYDLYKDGLVYTYLPIIVSLFLNESSVRGNRVKVIKERWVIANMYSSGELYFRLFLVKLRLFFGRMYRMVMPKDHIERVLRKRLISSTRVKWIQNN